MVELLVAMAITAILLTAVAVAFNASIMNYRVNEDIFRSVNDARQALFRLTTQLRTAAAVDPNAPANECSMITAGGEDITYRYDSGDSVLYLITNDDTTDADYVLCRNVEAMTFTKATFVDDAVIKVKSVQIAISVRSNSVTTRLAAAAAIRRNLD